MKVEITQQENSYFGDIPYGECFVYGGDYYMRIIDGNGVDFSDRECAVDLSAGMAMAFGEKVEVRPISLKAVQV